MSLNYAILGLLDLAPMSGYDLKKAFDGSVAHFWAADQAQIYRTLAKLEEEGWVEVRVIAQDGRPDRRENRITDLGRQALSEWLRSPLPAERDREPFLARLFFAGREGADVVRALLRERRAAAEERLEALRAITHPRETLPARLRAATIRYGLRHLEAELAWLDEVEGEL